MNDYMVMGVCWYKEEQWERLKEIVADPENIEDTYMQWKVDAEKTINELRNNGANVKKVSVDTEKMLLWANENNRPINGKARSEYAAYLLRQRKKT
jgi:phage-related minor tail protein